MIVVVRNECFDSDGKFMIHQQLLKMSPQYFYKQQAFGILRLMCVCARACVHTCVTYKNRGYHIHT